MTVQSQIHTNCCPRFHPDKWNEKAVIWDEKPFIRARVKAFLHMPRDFGKVVTSQMGLIKASGAQNPGGLMLSDENSMWGSDLYIAVDKAVSGANNVSISGKFISKVFEGPCKDAGKWTKEMLAYVKSKNKEAKRLLFWYTTCPKCAKVYGKNYVVVFADIGAPSVSKQEVAAKEPDEKSDQQSFSNV